MKGFIEITLISGQSALVNINDIALVVATTGEDEPRFSHMGTDSEYRYTTIRVTGEPNRLDCCDDYNTIISRIENAL